MCVITEDCSAKLACRRQDRESRMACAGTGERERVNNMNGLLAGAEPQSYVS